MSTLIGRPLLTLSAGEWLALWRRSRNINANVAAKRMSVSPGALRAMEHHQRPVPERIQRYLCNRDLPPVAVGLMVRVAGLKDPRTITPGQAAWLMRRRLQLPIKVLADQLGLTPMTVMNRELDRTNAGPSLDWLLQQPRVLLTPGLPDEVMCE